MKTQGPAAGGTAETQGCESCMRGAEHAVGRYALSPQSTAAASLRPFTLRHGPHRMLMHHIQKRLRVPESYEHIATCACGEGRGLRVLTAFKARNHRGEYRTEHLVASLSADGSILSVNRI